MLRDTHYTVDEKQKSILITEEGYEAAEEVLEVGHDAGRCICQSTSRPMCSCMIVPTCALLDAVHSSGGKLKRLTAQLQSLFCKHRMRVGSRRWWTCTILGSSGRPT